MLRARQLRASQAALPGHARYRLEVRRCGAELEVFSFTGEERLCAPYCYTIDFTSPTRDIDPAVMLNKSATFILQAPENPAQVRKVHGVTTVFQSVEKTGKCEPAQDKANVLLCPVKMRVKQAKVGEPMPRYYEVTDKISIYQKDGVWKADDNSKGQILLSIIVNDANETLLGRLNPGNLK